jgi:pyruvate,water dikinase
MTKRIKSLDQLTPDDLPNVGGKAYNCAHLRQKGFPVPDGFAITTDVMDKPVQIESLDKTLNRFSDQTLFAVRSSAADEDSTNHSFAGIHETKLNVTRDGITEAIKACLESIQSPRAIAYRQILGLETEKIKSGILVQEMIKSIVSGVAFTVNPVTGVSDELVINASWGLGEALVSGRVEPDEYRVRKSDGAVLASRIGSKRYRVVSRNSVLSLFETNKQQQETSSLTDGQLLELVNLLVRVEQEYGIPQDVEWCHDGSMFWILQTRPVTTQYKQPSHDILWTRANAREILPDLTSPQALLMLSETLERAERFFYTNLVAPEAELGPVAKGFYGRLYFNLSQLLHVAQQIGQQPSSLLNMIGHNSDFQIEYKKQTDRTLLENLHVLHAILRIFWRIFNVSTIIRRQFDQIDEYIRLLASREPDMLSDTEIWAVIRTGAEKLPEFTWKTFPILAGLSMYRDMVSSICRNIGFSTDRFLDTQLAVGEQSISAQQGLDIIALANHAMGDEKVREYFLSAPDSFYNYKEALLNTSFLREFEKFLETYGHRSDYESDWSLPRYYEDPSSLLSVIRAHIQEPSSLTPEQIRIKQEHDATETWQEFLDKVTWWQRFSVIPRVRWALKRAKQLSLWRERNRFELIRCISELRWWNLVLAERFVSRGWVEKSDDYFFLELNEVGMVVDGNKDVNAKSIIAKRKRDYETWQHFEMPMVMRESELTSQMRKATSTMPVSSVTILRGLSVSSGIVEGEVVVITKPAEFVRMKKDAILVAPATNPTWTPLFTLASGIIVEIGGTLSHSSIVAREYGLPAIANVKDATKLLKDGDRVRLDAENETIELLH